MKFWYFLTLSIASLLGTVPMAFAVDEQLGEAQTYDAKVIKSYIDLRTGPGRGYPVDQIIEQDQWLRFIQQKTQWIYVQSARGVAGWMASEDLTGLTDGAGAKYNLGVQDAIPDEDYIEVSLNAGNFGGSQSISAATSYAFTANLTGEINLGQAIGDESTTSYIGLQFIHLAKPIYGFRPYFLLGAGRLLLEPSSRVAQPLDRQDDFLKTGLGLRRHVDGRFYLKLEYAPYLVLRSQDDDDEVNEWKLGISAVF